MLGSRWGGPWCADSVPEERLADPHGELSTPRQSARGLPPLHLFNCHIAFCSANSDINNQHNATTFAAAYISAQLSPLLTRSRTMGHPWQISRIQSDCAPMNPRWPTSNLQRRRLRQEAKSHVKLGSPGISPPSFMTDCPRQASHV